MVQEMKPYHIDFPNVKNNCLRFEVSPSIEESATFTDADWAELGNDAISFVFLLFIFVSSSFSTSKNSFLRLQRSFTA